MKFRDAFACIAATAVGLGSSARAHDAFLPLHEHNPAAHAHSHGSSHANHDHAQSPDGKHLHLHDAPTAPRWVVATGTQYTRFSLEGARAEFWEAGLGFEFVALPWLHMGGDVSYGWFN